ncbi:MAG: class I SAM-dependent methyltransferase [Syntrophomonadaceae bacterium]|nr:class I SAM-dependent methyltransferase [Syntrophomonadaceae bacterium]
MRSTDFYFDSSPEMVGFARRQFLPAEYPSLAFFCQDARELNFDRVFDLVVSFACRHWVIDHRPVLRRVKRALWPGGRVFLQCGGKGNAAAMVMVRPRGSRALF